MKYNYTGAAALWLEYYNVFCEPWAFSDDLQKERRLFMRCFTRGIDTHLYIDYAKEVVEGCMPAMDAKSRCYDFESDKLMNDIINHMICFKGVIE